MRAEYAEFFWTLILKYLFNIPYFAFNLEYPKVNNKKNKKKSIKVIKNLFTLS